MDALGLTPEMNTQQKVVEETFATERKRLFNFIKTRVSDP